MDTQFTVIAYGVYLPVAIGLTLFVARTLFKNGRIFMLDIFNGREEIAFATNRLFEVGFYLLNIGFALLILKITQFLPDARSTIEVVSYKVGGFAIYLGLMLFFNLYLFFRGKRKSAENRRKDQTPQLTPPNQ